MSTGPAPRRRRNTQSKTNHSPNAHPNVFSVPAQRAGTSKAYDATAELEEKIEKLEKDIRTERFIWIFVVIILGDILSFKVLDNSVIPFIIIVIIELIVLCAIGKYLGNEYVTILCEKALETITNYFSKTPPK